MLNQELRKTGIGGSEVAAILGLDDFSSPYKVWLAKTGRETSSSNNKYTEAGLILESAVAEYFEQRTTYRIIKSSAKSKTFTHPQYEFAIGTPDRQYMIPKVVGRGILECKTTQYAYDDIPEKWFIQLQWYLGVMGSAFGSVAWLEHGLDFKYREYTYDREFFDYLMNSVATFWNDHVVKDVPPEPINVDDVNRIYTRHAEGKRLEATIEMIGVHSELLSVREAIAELQAKEKAMVDSVKMVMLDAEIVATGIQPLFTWKTAKDSMRFDEDKFKEDNPELWEKYRWSVSGSRRFLIK